jgi:EF-P beta-lysylation protein EpmB
MAVTPLRILDDVHSSSKRLEPWLTELKACSLSLSDLLHRLHLTADAVQVSEEAAKAFAIKAPAAYLNRIRKGDPNDPLLLQILPDPREMELHPGYSNDPLEELGSNPIPGLIHKYHGRVLLVLSGACAIHCRYCFRRHFPYSDQQTSGEHWDAILEYISKDPSINEVIFSGGDPLVSTDKRLFKMLKDLEAIPHLTRVRIHSRLPVVLPNRITPELSTRFEQSRLNIVCVVHINHANEIDHTVDDAIDRLKSAKVTVLNQSVLLKGINDSVEVLCALSERLFEAGILPYYLFVLDAVQGAAHFDITDQNASELVRQMQARLPGFLVPKLAREIPGKPSKTWLPV